MRGVVLRHLFFRVVGLCHFHRDGHLAGRVVLALLDLFLKCRHVGRRLISRCGHHLSFDVGRSRPLCFRRDQFDLRVQYAMRRPFHVDAVAAARTLTGAVDLDDQRQQCPPAFRQWRRGLRDRSNGSETCSDAADASGESESRQEMLLVDSGAGLYRDHQNSPISELLVGPQVAPLADWQSAQRHVAAADALQSGHEQTHELAHAADLPLAALAQHEAQLMFVLP